MRRFATILAVVMSSAHLASRILVDKQHHILEANAKKEQPGTLPLGLLRPDPADSRVRNSVDYPGPQLSRASNDGRLFRRPSNLMSGLIGINDWRQLLPPGTDRPLALATWSAATLAAARVGTIAVKHIWKNSTKNTVSDGITAKAQLGVARSALEKASVSPRSALVGESIGVSIANLEIALVAMDNTQAAFNAAQPAFDSSQRVPDDLLEKKAAEMLGAVEAAMDNTQAAMNDVQETLDDLLRLYPAQLDAAKVEAFRVQVPAGASPGDTLRFRAPDNRLIEIDLPPGCKPGQKVTIEVETRNDVEKTAIAAAIEALEEARALWGYDVQRMEAVNQEETAHAERVAVKEADSKDIMAVEAAQKAAQKLARAVEKMEGKEPLGRAGKKLDRNLHQAHAALSEANIQHNVVAANQERLHRQAKIWKNTFKVSTEDKTEPKKSKTLLNSLGLWT